MITSSTALAPVNEEAASSTHFAGFLGLQVEGTRFGYGRIMHGILAIGKFILGGREWASVDYALLLGVHKSFMLTTVTMSVNYPFARASNKVTGILVISVGLLRS